MTTHISCGIFADALSDLLERDLPESARVAMEAHAAGCDECGPLLADLRRLHTEASNLPELAPSRDLWAGIAARIETPVVELTPSPRQRDRGDRDQRTEAMRLRRSTWMRRASLGLAAAGLVAATATITREVTKRSMAAPATVAATTSSAASLPAHDSAASSVSAPSGLVASTPAAAARDSNASAKAGDRTAAALPVRTTLAANHAKPSAQQTYDREISTLRAVLAYRRKDLDSATVAVVDKNLQIIDDAIAQCQQALKKDPQSRFLLESLNDALDEKVQLLRTAATLPSRS